MKHFNLYITLLLASLLFACQNKEDNLENVGYLRLDVTSSTAVTTKAETVYNPKQIAVKIINSAGITVQETDDWTSWQGESFELPTGEYTIQASSNGFDGQTAAFNKPYYAGSKEITITKGTTINAEIVCTLANVKVSVEFSDSFKAVFQTASVQISNALEGAIPLSFLMADDLSNKFAYFPVSPLAWEISVTNKNGVSNKMGETITDVAAKDHFRFYFTIASSSNITISVDETMKEYIYNIGIPTVLPPLTTKAETANAWSTFAYLNGAIQCESTIDANGATFKYKKADATDDAPWEIINATLQNNGSKYVATAKITGLEVDTEYQYLLHYQDTKLNSESNIATFRTERQDALHNGNFDIWNQNKKTWFAGTSEEASSTNSFWDSGNVGTSTGLASILGAKNPTSPETSVVHTPGENAKSGKLTSQYVGLGGSAGQFAAGNIYTGHFVKVIGTSGAELQFGQPFTSRPIQLHGWFRYSPGSVDYVGSLPSGVTVNKGDTDKNAIYIALSDKGSSYTVNTSEGSFIDFNNDPNIIAYGELPIEECVNTNEAWKEFRINLKYRSLERKPTHIIIVASASKYGDYFTGSTSSVMYIDDFELIYDGEPEK